REDLAAHCLDDGAEGLLHVLCLPDLMLAPLPVEAQHGNAPSVDDVRIDLAVALLARDHLAAAGKADHRAVVAPVVVLELPAPAAARRVALDTVQYAVARHVEAATDLDVIAAREVERAVVEPPWHVDVAAAGAVLVVRRSLHHLRDEALHA